MGRFAINQFGQEVYVPSVEERGGPSLGSVPFQPPSPSDRESQYEDFRFNEEQNEQRRRQEDYARREQERERERQLRESEEYQDWDSAMDEWMASVKEYRSRLQQWKQEGGSEDGFARKFGPEPQQRDAGIPERPSFRTRRPVEEEPRVLEEADPGRRKEVEKHKQRRSRQDALLNSPEAREMAGKVRQGTVSEEEFKANWVKDKTHAWDVSIEGDAYQELWAQLNQEGITARIAGDLSGKTKERGGLGGAMGEDAYPVPDPETRDALRAELEAEHNQREAGKQNPKPFDRNSKDTYDRLRIKMRDRANTQILRPDSNRFIGSSQDDIDRAAKVHENLFPDEGKRTPEALSKLKKTVQQAYTDAVANTNTLSPEDQGPFVEEYVRRRLSEQQISIDDPVVKGELLDNAQVSSLHNQGEASDLSKRVIEDSRSLAKLNSLEAKLKLEKARSVRPDAVFSTPETSEHEKAFTNQLEAKRKFWKLKEEILRKLDSSLISTSDKNMLRLALGASEARQLSSDIEDNQNVRAYNQVRQLLSTDYYEQREKRTGKKLSPEQKVKDILDTSTPTELFLHEKTQDILYKNVYADALDKISGYFGIAGPTDLSFQVLRGVAEGVSGFGQGIIGIGAAAGMPGWTEKSIKLNEFLQKGGEGYELFSERVYGKGRSAWLMGLKPSQFRNVVSSIYQSTVLGSVGLGWRAIGAGFGVNEFGRAFAQARGDGLSHGFSLAYASWMGTWEAVPAMLIGGTSKWIPHLVKNGGLGPGAMKGLLAARPSINSAMRQGGKVFGAELAEESITTVMQIFGEGSFIDEEMPSLGDIGVALLDTAETVFAQTALMGGFGNVVSRGRYNDALRKRQNATERRYQEKLFNVYRQMAPLMEFIQETGSVSELAAGIINRVSPAGAAQLRKLREQGKQISRTAIEKLYGPEIAGRLTKLEQREEFTNDILGDKQRAQQEVIDNSPVLQESPTKVVEVEDQQTGEKNIVTVNVEQGQTAQEAVDAQVRTATGEAPVVIAEPATESPSQRSEWDHYVNTGEVRPETVDRLVDKIASNQKLTQEEIAMLEGAASEIESRLQELAPTEAPVEAEVQADKPRSTAVDQQATVLSDSASARVKPLTIGEATAEIGRLIKQFLDYGEINDVAGFSGWKQGFALWHEVDHSDPLAVRAFWNSDPGRALATALATENQFGMDWSPSTGQLVRAARDGTLMGVDVRAIRSKRLKAKQAQAPTETPTEAPVEAPAVEAPIETAPVKTAQRRDVEYAENQVRHWERNLNSLYEYTPAERQEVEDLIETWKTRVKEAKEKIGDTTEATPEVAPAETTKAVDTAESLDAKTGPQLKAQLKEMGVKGYSGKNKAGLIKMILEAQAPTEAAEGPIDVSGIDVSTPEQRADESVKMEIADKINAGVVYRGAREGNPQKLYSGKGNYFISSESFAKTYGKTAAWNVTIENPLIVSEQEWMAFQGNSESLNELFEDNQDRALMAEQTGEEYSPIDSVVYVASNKQVAVYIPPSNQTNQPSPKLDKSEKRKTSINSVPIVDLEKITPSQMAELESTGKLELEDRVLTGKPSAKLKAIWEKISAPTPTEAATPAEKQQQKADEAWKEAGRELTDFLGGGMAFAKKGESRREAFDRLTDKIATALVEQATATGLKIGELAKKWYAEKSKGLSSEQKALMKKVASKAAKVASERLKAEQQKEQPKEKPEEAPKETTPTPKGEFSEEVYSIKNANVDADLRALGLPLPTPGEELAFQKTLDEAATATVEDADSLVVDLLDNPRAPSAWESALLTVAYMRAKKQYDTAKKKAAELAGKGGRTESEATEKLKAAQEKYDQVHMASRLSGRESGRSLAFRRMIIREDYSLVNMQYEARILNKGDLSKEQKAEVEKLHDSIEKLEAELSEMEAKSSENKAAAKMEEEHKKIEKEVNRPTRRKRKARIVTDDQADKAKERIKKRLQSTLTVGVDPEMLYDVTLVGLNLLENGVNKFSVWSAQVIDIAGDAIKPHLKDIWNDARSQIAQLLIDETSSALSLADKNDKPINYNRQARAIYKEFVVMGQDMATALQSTHEVFNESVKEDFTIEQVRDLVSGYGVFKQLSQEDLEIRLRDDIGQMQQLAKIEAMLRGEAPLKTGVERRDPSDAERLLMKEVERLKKEGNYSNAEQALKSAFASMKTRLENQIKDLDNARALNTPIDKRSKAELTKEQQDEIDEIEKRRDEAVRLYKDMFPPETKVLDEQDRQEASIKRAEQRILELEDHIDRGVPIDRPGKLEPNEELRQLQDKLGKLYGTYRKLLPVKEAAEERRLAAELRKTEKSIADLRSALATGKPIPKSVHAAVNKALADLRSERDQLREQYRKRFPQTKKRLTDEQKIESRIKDAESSIEKLEDALKNKTPLEREQAGPTNRKLDSLRKKRESLRAQYRKEFGDAQKLERDIKASEKSIEEMENALRTGKPLPKHTTGAVHPLLAKVNERRDAVRKRYREKFPTVPTGAQRVALAEKALERAIERNKKRVRDKDVGPTKGRAEKSAKLTALKAENDALLAELELIRRALKPKLTQEQKDTKRKISELKRKIKLRRKALASGKYRVETRESEANMEDPVIKKLIDQERLLTAQANERFGAQRVLDRDKAAIKRQIAGYLSRIANAEYSTQKRSPRERKDDAEMRGHRLELMEAKRRFSRLKAKYEWDNMRWLGRKPVEVALQLYDLVRTAKASIDFSGFRQASFASMVHPLMAAKAGLKMFKSAWSEEGRLALEDEMKKDAYYDEAKKNGVAFTERDGDLSAREEEYMSQWLQLMSSGVAAKTLKGKAGQIAFYPYAVSERAFSSLLNVMRLEYYKTIVSGLPLNEAEKGKLARFVNSATGRGDMALGPDGTVALTRFIWAPKLLRSRFNLLLGAHYFGTEEMGATLQTRKVIFMQYIMAMRSVGALLMLAAASRIGEDEEEWWSLFDLRGSKAGTIKIGDSYVDPWGGMKQLAVFMFRLGLAETRTWDGEIIPLDEGIFHKDTTNLISRFIVTKLNPSAGILLSLRNKHDMMGRPMTKTRAVYEAVSPLAPQEAIVAMKQEGIPVGAFIGLLGMLGASIMVGDDELLSSYEQIFGPLEGPKEKRKAERERKEQQAKDAKALGMDDESLGLDFDY